MKAKKITPGREMRAKLLRTCMEMGLSHAELAQMTKPMHDMTDPEKEAYAEKLLEELEHRSEEGGEQ